MNVYGNVRFYDSNLDIYSDVYNLEEILLGNAINIYGNVRNYDSNLDIYSNVYEYEIDYTSGLIYYISLNLNTQVTLTLIR